MADTSPEQLHSSSPCFQHACFGRERPAIQPNLQRPRLSASRYLPRPLGMVFSSSCGLIISTSTTSRFPAPTMVRLCSDDPMADDISSSALVNKSPLATAI
ncbi:hypothetical protein V2G26_003052 [Clonostachys chloroleuca]